MAVTPADTLAGLRAKIDQLDDRLLALLARRQRLAGQIAHAKQKAGEAVHQPAREEQLLARVLTRATELGLPLPAIKSIFQKIFAASRAWQKQILKK